MLAHAKHKQENIVQTAHIYTNSYTHTTYWTKFCMRFNGKASNFYHFHQAIFLSMNFYWIEILGFHSNEHQIGRICIFFPFTATFCLWCCYKCSTVIVIVVNVFGSVAFFSLSLDIFSSLQWTNELSNQLNIERQMYLSPCHKIANWTEINRRVHWREKWMSMIFWFQSCDIFWMTAPFHIVHWHFAK